MLLNEGPIYEKLSRAQSSITLWANENERKKTEQVTIPLPRAAGSCFEAKKIKENFLLVWTSEIIQFIQFENHMDGPG